MNNKPTVVIALGGNALSNKKDSGTVEEQFKHTRDSLKPIMHFVRAGYNICITHGNGPQVGAELLRNEIASKVVPPLPLGMLVANTQGAMGYMIQQSLQNALYNENEAREVVTFISQIKVEKNDPSIVNPEKFIGKVYDRIEANNKINDHGWTMKEQESGSFRRVVSSPTPKYIFNGKSIKHLVDFGTIVIAGGGGGIPAYNEEDGTLEGLDGVVDKDKTAALIGRIIRAKELFIVTDVDNIYLNYKKENQKKILCTNPAEIETWLKEGHFQRGTMEPKIKAALYFLEHHGHEVVITSINKIKDAINGRAGTKIIKE